MYGGGRCGSIRGAGRCSEQVIGGLVDNGGQFGRSRQLDAAGVAAGHQVEYQALGLDVDVLGLPVAGGGRLCAFEQGVDARQHGGRRRGGGGALQQGFDGIGAVGSPLGFGQFEGHGLAGIVIQGHALAAQAAVDFVQLGGQRFFLGVQGFVGILPGLLCSQDGRLLFEAGEFFAQGHFGVNHVFLQNFSLGGRGALGFRLARYGKGMSALAALHPPVGCLQIGYGIMIFRLAAGATEFDGFHVSAIQILMFRPLF